MRDDYDDLLENKRTFKVRGETFTWNDVHPKILESWQPKKNGKTPLSTWDVLDQQMLLFLVPEDHERWLKLSARTDQPLTIAQRETIILDLVEASTQRPTIVPSE